MPKKIIQDIYTSKKSIRLINRSDIGKSKTADKRNTKKPLPEKRNRPSYLETDDKKIPKSSQFFLWVICIAVVVFLLYIVSSVFSSATITITPKKETISLNDTYNISTKATIDGLRFEVMTVKKEMSKLIDIDGEEYVERKSIGKAVIYNNDSTSKQRLINNTRLETSDGLIYRIRQSVDVPGIKTVNGVKTPGSVEVEIIADVAGEKYNMKLSDLKGDFTIPGFKGSTKYKTFYARLSADTAGGFIGKVPKVSEQKLVENKVTLENDLRAELLKEIYSQKPEGGIIFKDNYFIKFNEPTNSIENSKYKISEGATAYVIVFKESEISKYLAKLKIKNFDDSLVNILGYENVVSTIIGTTEKIWEESSLKVKFVGKTDIVWQYDSNTILSKIKGQNKKIIQSILDQNIISITEIKASIRPQWNQSFPENSKKIKIIDSIRNIIK
jgi:hypothetical protein